MREHKRISDKFKWIPLDKRTDRFGLRLPPRKAEKRTPKFWLKRSQHELYFVNNSEEILELVDSSTGGFETSDDVTITVTSDGYHYDNVKPQEAVKIEGFDDYYDLDYVLQVVIVVKSEQEGTLKIKSPPEKGGIKKEVVLLWDTGEAGKFVSIQKI